MRDVLAADATGMNAIYGIGFRRGAKRRRLKLPRRRGAALISTSDGKRIISQLSF
jgi:hypothetical protein